ncbi:tetratricopeptide repeat protein [Oceanimonas sp. MB9]|uniref:tetratricopeptide repeat protein n=1 Tax=Oceanimonas sp. MB9 TaxID=2588453 RepID=UPI0013F5CE9C|nr:tetratricopeptide repeat protein [Oceanimonas sp. MB9]NHI02293.1 hypothetical protein [Oceanimonas sp. MB9]
MKQTLVLIATACLMSGCASLPAQNAHSNDNDDSPYLIGMERPTAPACESLSREHELAVSYSREMVSAGKLHAALANLERLPPELPAARAGKAQVLRLLKRPEAETLYRDLLETCLVAEGYHGLAQMAVQQGDNQVALQYMRQAIIFEPTNEAMRNDLGVIYMNLRHLDEARFELLTAAELNESNQRALLNLLALTLYQDNFNGAARLTSRYQLSSKQYQSALAKAKAMRQQDQSSVVEAGIDPVSKRKVDVASIKQQPPPAKGVPTSGAIYRSDYTARNDSNIAKEGVTTVRRVQGVQRVDTVAQPIVPISIR